MQFRLVIRGALPPHRKPGATDAKHRIRQELHPQMRMLWDTHPVLRGKIAHIPEYASDYEKCGFRFLPLITSEDSACSLDILLLRRTDQHKLVHHGDIDARVKTLLDGLQMPQQCSELNGATPEGDENPMFVLMDNDKAIYEMNVTTDRLLVPPEPDEPHRDIVAIIGVKTISLSGSVVSIHSHAAL